MVVTKKSIKKKGTIKSSKAQNENTQKILIENFVSLQKVMVNLSVKFDDLTKQLSQLLNLFEISAKALAEKDNNGAESKDNEKIIGKIDNLIDQNKILARGLTLLHETEGPAQPPHSYLPRMQPPTKNTPKEEGAYQSSISSTAKKFNQLPK